MLWNNVEKKGGDPSPQQGGPGKKGETPASSFLLFSSGATDKDCLALGVTSLKTVVTAA